MLRPSLYVLPSSVNVPEVDLRKEFDELVMGTNGRIRHGHFALIRRMRRDPNGYPTACTCYSESTSKQGNPSCPYCAGEGYLWVEEWVILYSKYLQRDGKNEIAIQAGEVLTDYKVFYLRYDSGLLVGDKIVEVVLDTEGVPKIPYVRDAIYKPETITQMRADNGRLEYIAAYCKERDALRNNNPQ